MSSVDFSHLIETFKSVDAALNLQVIALYQFGSFGSEYQTSESDLDLGILANRLLTTQDRFSIMESLSSAIPHGLLLDLVDLSRVDSVMAALVITNGVRIWVADETKADRFELYALSRYARLNEERKLLLADVIERGSIYNAPQKVL